MIEGGRDHLMGGIVQDTILASARANFAFSQPRMTFAG
jgi:hypothetical protein